VWHPKELGPGGFSLNVWLHGATEQAVHAEWELMLRAAAPAHRRVKVKKVLPGGEVRWCWAELSGAISPVPVGAHGMRARLMFSIPEGSWWTDTTYTYSSTAGVLPGIVDMPAFANATAPIDPLLRIIGPITAPTVRNGSAFDGGHWLKVKGGIPAGGSVEVDSTTWRVTATGFSLDEGDVSFSGARFMTLFPQPPGAAMPRLTLEGSGHTATTQLQVVAPARYR
jgi:hypothetical protein